MGIRYQYILPLLLTACTTPNVRDTSLVDNDIKKCETVDCVISEMDKLPQGLQEDRFPFMEGYPDSRLAEMKSKNQLDVEIMNPIFLTLGTYGYSFIYPYKYGGMGKCEVRYLPGFNWLSLKHELSHCQGYVDKGIPMMTMGYTEDQMKIMEKEHVNRWIDTTVYKNSIPKK